MVEGLDGGDVPQVDAPMAKRTFAAMHRAIDGGLVRACHDLSEGGLAATVAEMAFAGGLGLEIDLGAVPHASDAAEAPILLFSESNTRFLVEVRPERAEEFEQAMRAASPTAESVPHQRIGRVVDGGVVKIFAADVPVINADVKSLKEAWQKPLRW